MKTALMLLLLAAPSFAQQKPRWESFSGSSAVTKTRTEVVRSEKEWEALWKEHKADQKAIPPKVDFSNEMVVAVFLGQRPNSGFTVEVETRVDPLDASRLVVFYKEAGPKKDRFVMPTVSYPFRMVRVPKAQSVVFELDAPCKMLESSQPEAQRGALDSQQLGRLNKQFEALKQFSFPR